jgi:hypothetical protein
MSVIQYLYAAILCSVGWFEKKLTVVLVLVTLRLMSIPVLTSFYMSNKSKNLLVRHLHMLN